MEKENNLQGFWSRGKFYPIIAGGSGTDAEVEDTEDVEEEDYEGQESEEDDDEDSSDDNSLANDFLQDIPDEHREVVEQYVKKWDAGVTRRFQELHSQYAPYRELGDPQLLAQAQHVFNLLQNDPQAVYEVLKQEFERQTGEQGLQGQQQPAQQQKQGQTPYEGLPEEFVTKFEQQQKVLESVAEFLIAQSTVEQQTKEDQELDRYINNLKTEFGDFDEDYVLTKMLQGVDGATAIKAWKRTLQEQVNAAMQNQSNAPLLLSDGGVVPQDQNSVTELGRNDVKSLVAGILAQSQQE